MARRLLTLRNILIGGAIALTAVSAITVGYWCLMVVELGSALSGFPRLCDIGDCTVVNHRGDKLRVYTDLIDSPPFVTVVTLKRAHDWFPTTLLTVTGEGLWVDLRWCDDDHAEVAMDFDKDDKVGAPVTTARTIQIKYLFGSEYYSPPHHGYEID